MNMFVLTRNVSASYRVIATLVTAAVILWAMGAYSFAEAANVTNLSDTLSDSAPGALSDHTIQFDIPSGMLASETITVTFEAATFDLSTIDEGDIDLSIEGVDQAVAATPVGTGWGAVVAGQTITLTNGSAAVTASSTAIITIGENVTGGDEQIVNPSPVTGNQSYEIDISAGADSGHTRVVILDTVLVTANIETTFDFIVSGTPTTTAINGTSTTITSSSTTIPFGTLSAGEIQTLAQTLEVTTNAIHGFVVTVEEDGHLESETGADIDNFDDSVTSDQPVVWNPPTDVISDENTWGHWGVTSDDFDTTRTNEFVDDAGTWAGVSTTPQVIFSHDGPADGETQGEGETTIGYQVEISPLQEAADDYSTVLTYIATPTF